MVVASCEPAMEDEEVTSFPLEVTSTTSAGSKMEDEESVCRNKELKVNSNEVSGEEFRRCSCVLAFSLQFPSCCRKIGEFFLASLPSGCKNSASSFPGSEFSPCS